MHTAISCSVASILHIPDLYEPLMIMCMLSLVCPSSSITTTCISWRGLPVKPFAKRSVYELLGT